VGIAFLALAVGLAGRPFTLGVAAGEITPTTALLWGRATPGAVRVDVSRDRAFRRLVLRRPALADGRRDGTIHVRVPGLRPGTRYFYRFRRGRWTSAVGRFQTAPQPARYASVRFAVTGDADATRAPGSSKPYFNRFEVYARMAVEHNAFDVNLGDTIYSDSDVAGAPPALTVDAKRAKYRLNLSLAALRRLRAAAGVYNQWDDHEFVNDFSRASDGASVYGAGVQAFTDYMPVTYSAADGLYRTFRWGHNLELFFLDERSFRSAKASVGGLCNNGGSTDLMPTAPAFVRAAFAAFMPALGRPAPAACLARIRDPARTMLGARQYARFTNAIAHANVTFKVIVNEVPIQQMYALPYDRWEGYDAERQKLLRFLHDHVPGAVFLTTDAHGNLVNDVRFRTLEAGGPVNSGITEVVTGPVATTTFAKEIDKRLGSAGAGMVLASLFFKQPPPRGVGMRCVAPDVYSYAEVSVTTSRLTVELKDAGGRRVVDVGGRPCAPVVIRPSR